MNRRTALYVTGTVFLGNTLAGCTIDGDTDSGDSSKRAEPTLQEVVVKNNADEVKRIGIEVVQNHGNRVHTGYSELEPSNSRTLIRKWPSESGEFSVVLHVPDDDRYRLVTFSIRAEHHDWNEDVKVVYEIQADDQLQHDIVELSSES